MTASYLLLNKPAGITSFEALKPVKKALESGKVGHTGTLDKFAAGLMIILAGGALKLSEFFIHRDKEYEAEVLFGVETDTLDPEGRETAVAPPPSREALEAALTRFRGQIRQRPPLYSAIHIDGKRAHRIARAGGVVEMPERAVMIHKLELLDYTPPVAKIAVSCSAGTYIRSLARDIALEAGSRAHLRALLRTSVSGFMLKDAAYPDSAEAILAARREIDPELFRILGIATREIDGSTARAITHGQNLDAALGKSRPDNGPRLALFYEGRLAAVTRQRDDGRWSYFCVMPEFLRSF